MIASVRGIVVKTGLDQLVVEVGGVGLLVYCPTQTCQSARMNHEILLQTVLEVSEDSLTLYGFDSADLRDAYELLRTAPGVGPSTALGFLNTLTLDQIRVAIQSGDAKTLCLIPRIGPKGAQKIILDLKDKVNSLGTGSTQPPRTSVRGAWQTQIIEGLRGLGWTESEASAACDAVAPLAGDTGEPNVAQLMKAALASLARK